MSQQPIVQIFLQHLRRGSLVLLVLAPLSAFSQSNDDIDYELDPISATNNSFMQSQRDSIDEIARGELATSLRKTEDDLRTLQQILDKRLIDKNDQLKLQALGVVLGDIWVNELGMVWKMYIDEKGRSRAVCSPTVNHCLFPITRFSYLIELGVKPNAEKIYREGAELMRPYLELNPNKVEDRKLMLEAEKNPAPAETRTD